MAARPLQPRKRPTQARARQTVTAIVQAAQEIFARLGYAAATTNKIAERAGVSIGSLYQYFPNKESILAALFEQQVRAGLPRIDGAIERLAAPGVSLREGLRSLIQEVVALHEIAPRLHQVLFDEVPRSERMRTLQAEAERHYVELTASVLARIPGIRRGDTRIIAHLLVQTTEALAHWMVLRAPRELDRQACLDEAVEMLSRYARKEQS